MNRFTRFFQNLGWLGVAQYLLAILGLLLLAAFEAVRQRWAAPAIWSPLVFFIPAAFVSTRVLIFHMSWLQLLMRLGQAAVLGLLILGIFAFKNYAAFLDVMIPAAWFTLGLTFWVLSHPIVATRRRSMLQAAREFTQSPER